MIITLLQYSYFATETDSRNKHRQDQAPFHHRRHHQCPPSPHFSFPISINRALKLLTDVSVSG